MRIFTQFMTQEDVDAIQRQSNGRKYMPRGVYAAGISFGDRCSFPEWCMVKDIFWGKDECVVQFHLPSSKYIKRHPYCLHLWKKIGEEYEIPPKEMY